ISPRLAAGGSRFQGAAPRGQRGTAADWGLVVPREQLDRTRVRFTPGRAFHPLTERVWRTGIEVVSSGTCGHGRFGEIRTIGNVFSCVESSFSLGTEKRHGAKLTTKRLFSTSHSSVDSEEMKRFQLLAHKWWDEEGEYAALHSMNDIRVPFIRDTLLNLRRNYHLGKPLAGVKILDVGCGGGLLSEPLGRLGASVTGIDPLEDNIRTADQHKSFDPVLAKRIQYKSSSLEEIVDESVETFDVIVASEVVEHVADLEMFIKCCSQVLKPEGSLFITTINKTQLSYVLGIVVAEKILGIVPEGTHEWEKFVPPEELERLLESSKF
ncbi:PREDICTED: hexaprenyldihydroxybenzoate methyltransferase, mitochondrial, partial [Eurypyga helias]|uniref:hexaprenyldihydroxybenzoate methyltransferase, mitochondrial n=1 Tax=Eurypyga helias TaxID=54383 RepID=UPI0005286B88